MPNYTVVSDDIEYEESAHELAKTLSDIYPHRIYNVIRNPDEPSFFMVVQIIT